MQQCGLRSLANPRLSGIVVGLSFTENSVDVIPGFFRCCHGQGQVFLESKNSVYRCGLQRRLKHMQELYEQYLRGWGQKTKVRPYLLNQNLDHKVLEEACDTLKGYGPQAHVHFGKAEQPSLLWPIAFVCAWRFACRVLIHTLGDGLNLFYAKMDQMPKDQNLVICIEQVRSLWDIKLAMEFEEVVQYAYRANAYLWVEFVEVAMEDTRASQTTNKVSESSVRQAFKQRIQKSKSKPSYDFLTPGCRSVLDSMKQFPRINN